MTNESKGREWRKKVGGLGKTMPQKVFTCSHRATLHICLKKIIKKEKKKKNRKREGEG
jgi:hypothetical protein